jgi:hypothetical protein
MTKTKAATPTETLSSNKVYFLKNKVGKSKNTSDRKANKKNYAVSLKQSAHTSLLSRNVDILSQS